MAWDSCFPYIFILFLGASPALGGMDSCYSPAGEPHYCLPMFENAAFLRQLVVTNTCGAPPEDYCLQTGSRGTGTPCHRCDAQHPDLQHNASALTDLHSDEEPTWWQSQSMAFGVQHPNSVNITLQLGKAYEITYVRLKFHTSRPESFAIYKRSWEKGPWVPYQYYSATCSKTYDQMEGVFLRPGDDEAVAFCTSEFSDISPLNGGNVAFSTLEGRPSAYNFDKSSILQEWVTSTDLLISLNRLNTFGDDIFKDKKVLQTYFYAISDVSVGGRCKCNGHASECVTNGLGQLLCNCQHNTTGVDCERCHPMYQDRPWARGTSEAANECHTCECSGQSEECFFDPALYRRTGHGGHCQNCRAHTAGPHCEHCQENFYRDEHSGACLPCACNEAGSVNLQCDNTGTCSCKSSVSGRKCDHCRQGFHSFNEGGCRPCSCHHAGTMGECDWMSGQCPCKPYVEGYFCDRCVPGTFNLQPQNPHGCSRCFCFTHSTVCTTAPGYGVHEIHSDFAYGVDRWRGEGAGSKEIPVVWTGEEISLDAYSEEDDVYFVAPGKFLGDQRLSYGQHMSLRLRVLEGEAFHSAISLVLEGSGQKMWITQSSSADCTLCAPHEQEVAFRLHEELKDETRASEDSFNVHRLLSNLTALHIVLPTRVSDKVFLRKVTLTSAQPGLSLPAPWIEECTCPPGYMGQFCQTCAHGFTRMTPSGGPFTRCVPCGCNQHGSCDPDTGLCHCLHHTEGVSCQRCMDGFYGNPFLGQPDDCQPCPCPGGSSCAAIPDSGEVVCTNCPSGQTGRRCELCDDGLFGDPLGHYGQVRPCARCDCSGNVDPNAVGNCHPVSGDCLRCLHNTEGNRCQRCREGFHGKALDRDHSRKCAPCDCHHTGSAGGPHACDPVTGQCVCLPHVNGRDCSQCRPGFYGMQPQTGCQSCDCHPVGSQSIHCDVRTGQCICHMGVEGVSCHHCHDGYFGFSSRGCRPCNCSPLGSISHQCHENGTCICRRGFVGYKCDQCEQNFFYSPARADCEECPTCYSLVKEQANKLNTKLGELQAWLSQSECIISGAPNGHHWTMQDSARGDGLPENHLLQELFLEYAQQLESSLSSAWAHLKSSSNATCTSPLGQKSCTLMSELDTTLASVQREAGLAAGTLRSMVIPLHISEAPSDWSRLATKYWSLVESQKVLADEVAETAARALQASNTSYEMLHRVVEEKHSQGDVEDLEDGFQAIQEVHAELKGALKKVTSEAKRTAASVRQINTKLAQNLSAPAVSWPKLLEKQARKLTTQLNKADLDLANWDQLLLNMTLTQGEAQRQLEGALQFQQVSPRAHSALTLASVAVSEGGRSAKEAESLLDTLEATKRGLARQTSQGALRRRKADVLAQKEIGEAIKKIKQAERMLGNSSAVSSTSKKLAQEAESLASKNLKAAKELIVGAKRERKRAAKLTRNTEETMERIRRQGKASKAIKKELDETEMIKAKVNTMGETLKKTRVLLEEDVSMLSRLLERLEKMQSEGQKAVVLNKGWAQLKKVQLGLSESGALERKMSILRHEGEQQRLKIMEYEKEIEDIQVDKANLEDIVRTLPGSCSG